MNELDRRQSPWWVTVVEPTRSGRLVVNIWIRITIEFVKIRRSYFAIKPFKEFLSWSRVHSNESLRGYFPAFYWVRHHRLWLLVQTPFLRVLVSLIWVLELWELFHTLPSTFLFQRFNFALLFQLLDERISPDLFIQEGINPLNLLLFLKLGDGLDS